MRCDMARDWCDFPYRPADDRRRYATAVVMERVAVAVKQEEEEEEKTEDERRVRAGGIRIQKKAFRRDDELSKQLARMRRSWVRSWKLEAGVRRRRR